MWLEAVLGRRLGGFQDSRGCLGTAFLSSLALRVGGGAGSRAPAGPLSTALSSDWSIVSRPCPSQPLSDGPVVQDGPAAGPSLRPCIMHQQSDKASVCGSSVGWGLGPLQSSVYQALAAQGVGWWRVPCTGGGICREVDDRREVWCHGWQYGPSWLKQEGWPTSSSGQPGKQPLPLPGLPGLL